MSYDLYFSYMSIYLWNSHPGHPTWSPSPACSTLLTTYTCLYFNANVISHASSTMGIEYLAHGPQSVQM